MPDVAVHYFVDSPLTDEERVIREIKSFGPWAKFQRRAFLIKDAPPVEECFERVMAHMMGEDCCIVGPADGLMIGAGRDSLRFTYDA